VRQPSRDQKLEQLESDFRPLLIACLKECQKGRWGLFGQNVNAESAAYLEWNDGENLKKLAVQIRALRAEFGQPSPLVERYIHYCSLRGSNVPGEPKLAKAFLAEIEKGDFDSR
jgi:hypothetical protein